MFIASSVHPESGEGLIDAMPVFNPHPGDYKSATAKLMAIR